MFTAAYMVLLVAGVIPNKVTIISEIVEALAWGGGLIADILDSLFGVKDFGVHVTFIKPIAVVISLITKLLLIILIFEGLLCLMPSNAHRQDSSTPSSSESVKHDI